MKYIRHPQQLRRLQNRPRKQPKPLPIVGIITARRSIKSRPVKQIRAIHKVMPHSLLFAPIHDSHKPVVVFKRNRDRPRCILPLARKVRFSPPHTKAGKRNVVPQLHQLPRQRSHHVGQAAGLRKWNALRSSKHDLHPIGLPVPRKKWRQRKHPAKAPVYYAEVCLHTALNAVSFLCSTF